MRRCDPWIVLALGVLSLLGCGAKADHALRDAGQGPAPQGYGEDRDQEREQVREATPGSPEEATPRSPEEATPGSPEEATPRSPEEASPRSPEEASPGSPEEATPRSPEEASPRSPEEAAERPSRRARSDPAPPLRRYDARVVATYPHDPAAFTQGLLLAGGTLLESTGRYGASELRRVDLESGEVMRRLKLPDAYFAEGLALRPGGEGGADLLVQLTWRSGVALLWDAGTFERRGERHYGGEGWGLCWDAAGGRFVMSDGSPWLSFHEPETFAETGGVTVTRAGEPVGYLNELECVGDRVYANVYGADQLVEIDPATGAVTAVVHAEGLLSAEERRGTDVLNGIAHDPADGTFLLTGKLWPKLFRVELVARNDD